MAKIRMAPSADWTCCTVPGVARQTAGKIFEPRIDRWLAHPARRRASISPAELKPKGRRWFRRSC